MPPKTLNTTGELNVSDEEGGRILPCYRVHRRGGGDPPDGADAIPARWSRPTIQRGLLEEEKDIIKRE